MNTDLINQLGSQFGANGLPYAIPIHPNLVHMTLGLFIVAIGFDFVGVFFVLEKPLFKFMAIPAARSNFFDVGWYNMIAASIVTFFTVGAGFYEILLASPDRNVRSAWGFQAMETMIWHGVGGVLTCANCGHDCMARSSTLCLAKRSRSTGAVELSSCRIIYFRNYVRSWDFRRTARF